MDVMCAGCLSPWMGVVAVCGALSGPRGVRLPSCRCSAWKGTDHLRQFIIFQYFVYSFIYYYHYFYFTLIFCVREFVVSAAIDKKRERSFYFLVWKLSRCVRC